MPSTIIKVAEAYELDLEMMEYRNALAEDPGSETNTLYVTNIREPVERSLSHFKYNARW